MTTMQIDRATVEQALEALRELLPDERDSNCGGYDARDVRQWRATARALRAALAQQAEPVQMHPSQFAELIKGKETMIGVPVYWSEWPTKERT